MKLFKLYDNKKAFSLLEVIIAIFVITVGITGALSLITSSISSVAISKSQIIATNLAQEGIEIVRNIRDFNWLQDLDWDNGLTTCASGCRVQYNSGSILALADNLFLKIDANGFYQYDDGTNTLFRRKITIISADKIKVVSEVTWSERGRDFNVSAENLLYDWK